MTDPARQGYRYWAFISYSSKDGEFARWLHRSIESYGIPTRFTSHSTPVGDPAPKRFKPIFHDRLELPASADLGAEIEDALRASRYLIVVCSPSAAQSKWVNKEIEIFKRIRDAKHILAIIAEGEPHGREVEECFPPALRTTEPIAADARSHADGRNNAKLKLLAGMLGVSFDALKDRDADLRMRRLRSALLAASALVLLFAFLAGLAWWQRRVAIQQRAVTLERTSSLRDILSRLIWKMNDDIEDLPGSLKLKDDMLDGAASQLQQLNAEDPADDGLSREVATTFSKLGSVKFEMGQTAAARANLQHALSIEQTLVAHDARNGFFKVDWASDLSLLGAVELSQGDPDSARSHLSQSLAILQGLASVLPLREAVLRETAKAHLLSAEAAWDSGSQKEAVAEFAASEGLFESLVNANPSVAQYRSSFATALFQEARFYRLNGNLALAARDSSRGAGMLKELNDSGTSINAAAKITAAGIFEMAETLLARGAINEAATDVNDALSFIYEVRRTDPEDIDAERIYIQGNLLHARILLASGQLEEANKLLLAALEDCKRIANIDDSNRDIRALQAIAEGELAMAALSSGAAESSRQHAQECDRLANSMRTSGQIPFPALRQLLNEMGAKGLV
jgi:eukaryotic-like serine/threonine-protein kinase